MASPIMEAGEKRPDIREYIPEEMSTGGVIVRLRALPESEALPPNSLPNEDVDVYFRAIIRYRGPSSHGRETGALWLYNADGLEFAVRFPDCQVRDNPRPN